ncbi:MAG: glycosyl transferase family 2 [Fimbriimonadales bacterium]|nr:MAG: glycosyl transferase family 2 [Fimbriimonadales bacterium]GIV10015.1 MAG: glycosyl transferase family 2 [Fimbriimonadales bacterium]
MWVLILGALSVQLSILVYNLVYWRRRRLVLPCSEQARRNRKYLDPLGTTAKAASSALLFRGEGEGYPTLSILIPARNERENLPRLLESLAPQLSAGVECWVCDDGSDDGTTEWLEQHAPQLRVRWFRSTPRPDGWVGKNWACYQLATRARGEWLLFLDADLRCEMGFIDALRGYLSRTDAQLVSAIPTFTPSSLPVAMLKLMVPFSVFTLLPLVLAERHPNPAFAFANGQVIAFRKADYVRWLPHFFVRKAVLEDVALAMLVKRQRGIVHLLDARAWLRVSMYPTLREAMDGFAKNAVAICRSVPMTVLVGLMLALVYLYPLGALLVPTQHELAMLAIGAAIVIFGLSARVVGLPFQLGWLYTGSIVLGLLTLGRSVRWYQRGMIVWKGRVYRT